MPLAILLLKQIVTIDRIECFASEKRDDFSICASWTRLAQYIYITKSDIWKIARSFNLRGGLWTEFKNTARTPKMLTIINNNNNNN